MRLFSHPRFLQVYSGALTLAFAVTVLCGFGMSRKARFDELDVERINVVEPDGRPRLIISDNARFPGAFLRGKEYPHKERSEGGAAGLIFLDEEASESGGLTFVGKKGKDGKVVRAGHLSFDRYAQDQVLVLEAGEEDGQRSSGVRIDDRPDWPMGELLELNARLKGLPPDQRQLEEERFWSAHASAARRAWLGRKPDGSSTLELKDAAGRDRLVAKVGADGAPVLELLDERGRVTSRLPQ